jgi:hypothetical protein
MCRVEKKEDIEVTHEMIAAGESHYPCWEDADEYNVFFLTRIYRAMAAADQRYGRCNESRVAP